MAETHDLQVGIAFGLQSSAFSLNTFRLNTFSLRAVIMYEDKELQEYRDLLKTQDHFEEGFSWKPLWGLSLSVF